MPRKATPKTVQTVQGQTPITAREPETSPLAEDNGFTLQDDETLRARIEIEQDENGEFHWTLIAANGRPLAINASGFKRRNDLTTTLSAVRACIAQAPVMMKIG